MELIDLFGLWFTSNNTTDGKTHYFPNIFGIVFWMTIIVVSFSK